MPTRREFLLAAGCLTARWALPERLLADPYGPPWIRAPVRRKPIRVQGRVAALGRGVSKVGITDGFSTVVTGSEGRYSLQAHPAARFVSIILPAGYRLPISATGTVLLHQPILPDRHGEASATFELEVLRAPDTRHAFLLLADPQTQNDFELERLRRETVSDVRFTVAGLGDVPVFGVSCGDIMYDDLSLYPEYERAVAQMGIPFFQVVGNHDLDFDAPTDRETTATFEKRFGPGHYAFNRGEVHYVVLDDVLWYGTGYVGYLDAEQVAWLESDLALVEAGATVVVCLHIPVSSTRAQRAGDRELPVSEQLNNPETLYRLLQPYRAHILAGHTHEHEHVFKGGVYEHVHGTVCGAWWSEDICWDGTPNGYAVYEVNGSELRWRYQTTGRGPAYQMRVYPPGADPSSPTEIIANIWDWDPEWTVVWYENGDRRGAMVQRIGLDPRSVEIHTGPEHPPRRTWVEPMPTGHMLYAVPSDPAGEITIEATDRFRRRYLGLIPRGSQPR